MGQRNWDCSKETKTSRSHHLLHLFPIPNALFSTYSLYLSLPTHHRQSQNKKLKPATPKNGQQTLPTIKEHRPESSLHDHRQTIPPPQIHTDSQFSPPWDFGIWKAARKGKRRGEIFEDQQGESRRGWGNLVLLMMVVMMIMRDVASFRAWRLRGKRFLLIEGDLLHITSIGAFSGILKGEGLL